ncbi:MAG: hypothetical protein O9284_16480 [Steroidobacteraceae bacterium]|jgi:hypothetical protein|nr:hypothetical protein [Steroidobacteraceae bacterium]
MPTLIVLFNLKPGASVEQYEAWAKSTDLPIVRGLPSIASFDVFRAQGLLSGAPSPYAYVEVIEVRDMDRFRQDVAVETMRQVAAQFREFADSPQFILTERI